MLSGHTCKLNRLSLKQGSPEQSLSVTHNCLISPQRNSRVPGVGTDMYCRTTGKYISVMGGGAINRGATRREGECNKLKYNQVHPPD